MPTFRIGHIAEQQFQEHGKEYRIREYNGSYRHFALSVKLPPRKFGSLGHTHEFGNQWMFVTIIPKSPNSMEQAVKMAKQFCCQE